MLKIDIIKQGESFPFVFNRGGQPLDGYICTIFVKQFPDDFPSIQRVIEKSFNENTGCEEWSGFLTSTETTGLNEGLWYLTASLVKSETDEEERQSIRFNVSKSWLITSPFFPTLLPNLVQWLDAADVDTIIQDDTSGRVSEWKDKSGNAHNSLQPDSSKQPETGTDTLNGLNVLTFNRPTSPTQEHLVTTLVGTDKITTEVLTYYSVSRRFSFGSSSPLNGLGAGENDSNDNIESFVGFKDPLHSPDTMTSIRNNLELSRGPYPGINIPYFAGGIFDGAEHTLYINGKDQTPVRNLSTVGKFNIEKLHIGVIVDSIIQFPDLFYQGDIVEIVIYNRALDAVERIQLNNYFSTKWGIPFS